MVLGGKKENYYLKVFYTFFTSNLLQLLQATKRVKKNLYIFGRGTLFRTGNPKKNQKHCDKLKQKDKRFYAHIFRECSYIDAYILN